MSEKNVNFDDKKIKRFDFYKNEKAIKTDIEFNKILVSKEEPYVHLNILIHLNILLDTMIMTRLDHYV